MTKLTYDNVFDAITDDRNEAADLKFRADMMLLLRDHFRAKKMTQADIGRELCVPQSRVSELMTGKIDKFSADKLIKLASAAGIRFQPRFEPAVGRRRATYPCEVSLECA